MYVFGTIQMMEYSLEFIPGTAKWVLDELNVKHSSVNLVSKSENLLIFESSEETNAFSDILGGLRITQAGEKNSLNLYRREWRKEYVPAGINPSLAYIMCEIAEVTERDVVLDPFCGGGTIPITAALYFNPKQVIASDISGKAIDITERNLARTNVRKVMVFRSDVSKLKLGTGSVSKIITNLPFGIREKTHDKNTEIYKHFAQVAKRVLSSGDRIIVLTQEIRLLSEILNGLGFKKLADYLIEQGGLRPHIFVFAKN